MNRKSRKNDMDRLMRIATVLVIFVMTALIPMVMDGVIPVLIILSVQMRITVPMFSILNRKIMILTEWVIPVAV